MFGDSCNFLHTITGEINSESILSKDATPPTVAKPSTPSKPPNLTVDSPQSVRSPPRSPRTTSLLHALRDVIGDPDEEDKEGVNGSYANGSRIRSEEWSESLPTLVNKTEFDYHYQPEESSYTMTARYDTDDHGAAEEEEGNWTAISVYDDDDSNPNSEQFFGSDNQPEDLNFDEGTTRFFAQSPQDIDERALCEPDAGDSEVSMATCSSPQAPTSGLLSPIELSTLNLAPLFQLNDNDYGGANSFDSGYADHWKPPMPLTATPPRSPSINSTFDLLSSPFGSHSARALSPRLAPFIGRPPSSPSQLASPQQDEAEPSDLSLDSPREYHARKQIVSEEEDMEDRGRQEDARFEDEDPSLSGNQNHPDDGADEDDSYGHASIWDSEGNPTAVFIGSSPGPIIAEVSDAITRSNKTPTHFLSSDDAQFEDAEVSSSSAFSIESSSTASQRELNGDSDEDTAYLAYLMSPAAQEIENDTLNSLYDIYSDIEAESDATPNIIPGQPSYSPVQLQSSLSNSSTPSSSLRERVFTPPAGVRKQSSFSAADSPNSLSSPMTSLDSVSRGRASPFSAQGTKSPTRNSSIENLGQELEVSRKIPFGFRGKLSLVRSGSLFKCVKLTSCCIRVVRVHLR